MSILNKLRQHELLRQFIKFCLIGVSNTAIDFVIYLLLTRSLGLYFLWANIISTLVATGSSFVLNKLWTFKNFEKGVIRQYVKFILVNLVYFLLYNSIVFMAVHWGQIYDLYAKAGAVLICLFWNFGANRYWTFRKTEDFSAKISQ